MHRQTNLTPIRIRGKRKPPPPHKTMPDTSLGIRKIRRSLSSVRASRSSRPRPALSSLPVELLESIFLRSRNIALPRSSHVIGARLSAKVTLRRFFEMAFHRSWTGDFGTAEIAGIAETSLSRTGRERRVFEADANADAKLQTELLEMPWADIDFILQAQQAWAAKFGRRGSQCSHRLPYVGEDGVVHVRHHSSEHYHNGLFNARACFDADYEQALKWPALFTRDLTWGTQYVHPSIYMPRDLMTAPWSEEKKRRLFWLARGGLQIGRASHSLHWETKVHCLESTIINIEEPDALVINCLIGAGTISRLPDEILRRHTNSLKMRIEWGADAPETKTMLREMLGLMTVEMDRI